jgi:Thioredoxin-like
MYPHERSLVKRLKDKPFALVGINSDDDREDLKKVVEKESLTWPSFFDGSDAGPIATRWNVQSWPTIYVLDHRGVIRVKNVRDKELDAAVDRLLDEMESAESRKTDKKE